MLEDVLLVKLVEGCARKRLLPKALAPTGFLRSSGNPANGTISSGKLSSYHSTEAYLYIATYLQAQSTYFLCELQESFVFFNITYCCKAYIKSKDLC